jgi:hypothetical protein
VASIRAAVPLLRVANVERSIDWYDPLGIPELREEE